MEYNTIMQNPSINFSDKEKYGMTNHYIHIQIIHNYKRENTVKYTRVRFFMINIFDFMIPLGTTDGSDLRTTRQRPLSLPTLMCLY